MEIILTKNCLSLTGSLGRGFGYHIKHRKNGFFIERNSNGVVPPDGHWKMICACANLAEMKLHVTDLKVTAEEMANALSEAGLTIPAYRLRAYPRNYPQEFNANDILNFKKRFNL